MPGLAQQALMHDSNQQWSVGDCVTDLSWSPDSSKVVISDAAGMVTVFNVQTGSIIWSVMAHVSGTLQVEWRLDGHMITSAGQDGTVKLWESETGAAIGVFSVGDQWVDHIAWSQIDHLCPLDQRQQGYRSTSSRHQSNI